MAKKTGKEKITLRETFKLHWRGLKLLHDRVPQYIPEQVAASALEAMTPYITVFLSARIIDELAGARDPQTLLFWVILAVALGTLLVFLSAAFRRRASSDQSVSFARRDKENVRKLLTMDYADVDRQEVNDLLAQVEQNANWAGNGLPRVAWFLDDAAKGVVGIFCAIWLTAGLFLTPVPETAGKLTVLNSPLAILPLFLAVLLPTLLSGFLAGKSELLYSTAAMAEQATLGNRLFMAFFDFFSHVPRALDIRTYRQQDVARSYHLDSIFSAKGPFAKLERGAVGVFYSLSEMMSPLLTGAVYVFVCLKALGGAFGVGAVTQYVAAVTAVTLNVKLLVALLAKARGNTKFLRLAFQFLDLPSKMYQGTLTTEKRSDLEYEVEFRDVSFQYPGSERWALRHVSTKFRVGSRLAVVGENGSGKSTFIKLLCRLYDPTEGEILLNGIDIKKYDYKEYMDIFSVVFQDFQLLAAPLGENVAGSTKFDAARAEKALVDAGFGDRLGTLPEGLNTMLYRDLDENGVLISGGEAQKIAIARALYKRSPFIILDEPTAALDPIAEAEIYAQFDKIAGDKTAIYISHRLSSCRFCDKIAVFSDGQIVQTGSHEELVENDGAYANLWNAQSQYYT